MVCAQKQGRELNVCDNENSSRLIDELKPCARAHGSSRTSCAHTAQCGEGIEEYVHRARNTGSHFVHEWSEGSRYEASLVNNV